MLRRSFLAALGASALDPRHRFARPAPAAPPLPRDDRADWVASLVRIARPVLENLAAGRLHARMPVAVRPGAPSRAEVSHLEAFGRTMAGIAPWLELGEEASDEGRLRARYAGLARAALAHAVDPASPDFMNWTRGGQPLVDAAFLAHALLRAPRTLQDAMAATTRAQLVAALASTRAITPYYSNWLLFSALIEIALLQLGGPWDRMRVDLVLRQLDEWYVGDGTYGDGPQYHWDYYNSYVIHPFLLDILRVLSAREPAYGEQFRRQLERARRFAEVQERLIAADGTFPVIGRSITYRCGAFQALAQLALLQELPPSLPPGQVRNALGAVIRRSLAAPDTFDADGWLQLGLHGAQPRLAETYISTGSLYLATTAFLPLGLAPGAPFWADPPRPWTWQRAWGGEDLAADHAL